MSRDKSKEIDPSSPEYGEVMNKLFANIWTPLEDARSEYSSLESKTYKDVKIENNFLGNSEPVEQAFKQMSGQHDYRNFSFFPQKDQQSISSGGIYAVNLNEVVQDVKNNPQYWRLDEVPTEIDRFGRAKKQEWLLIRWDAKLDDYDQWGKLNFNNNPIYRWESFNAQQRLEIKKVLKISVEYLTNDEIKWVVKEVKENPKVWRIGEIDKQNYLIHSSAQIKRDEIGTLIHSQQKFSEAEIEEINKVFERARLIDEIKQNNTKLERGLYVIDQAGNVSENEDWFIHNQSERKIDDKTGYLVYVPNEMIRAKDLSEAEQKEVGYKTQSDIQTEISPHNHPQGGGSSGGGSGWGSVAIWGFTSVISIIGLMFVK